MKKSVCILCHAAPGWSHSMHNPTKRKEPRGGQGFRLEGNRTKGYLGEKYNIDNL